MLKIFVDPLFGQRKAIKVVRVLCRGSQFSNAFVELIHLTVLAGPCADAPGYHHLRD